VSASSLSLASTALRTFLIAVLTEDLNEALRLRAFYSLLIISKRQKVSNKIT
jgi:hypothetical protein